MAMMDSNIEDRWGPRRGGEESVCWPVIIFSDIFYSYYIIIISLV